MNKDIVEGNWKQMRGHIKEWWGKLTNDDLDKINGQCDRLVGLIQEKYGYTKAQAEQELERHLSDCESYAGMSPGMPQRDPEQGMQTTSSQPLSTHDHPGHMHASEPTYSTHTAAHLARVLPVSIFMGFRVINPAGDDLGKIEDIAMDMASGRIAYAVLSFGGFLGFGSKYFALPWEALRLSSAEEAFILHVDRGVLEKAPGFDKDQWPEMADRQWGAGIYSHFGYRPYWEE
jgi:uncharacterized protein YjbJ (UPF0337 family)/sporulation protein YlmC with PRC-barrel domain